MVVTFQSEQKIRNWLPPCQELLSLRPLPQNHNSASPLNGNLLLLNKFQEEAANRKKKKKNNNWSETQRWKMAKGSASSRPWDSSYAHCNTLAKWHTHQRQACCHDSHQKRPVTYWEGELSHWTLLCRVSPPQLVENLTCKLGSCFFIFHHQIKLVLFSLSIHVIHAHIQSEKEPSWQT